MGQIFIDINSYIFEKDHVDLEHAYIDGTKNEANANRYSWVWKKSFFGLSIKFFFGLTLPTQNVGEDFIVFYFMELIINRISSLIIQPLYSFRALLTCSLLIPMMKLFQILAIKSAWFFVNLKWIVIIVLIVVFLFSYRKQTDYIRNRIESVNRQEAGSSEELE